jgi:hypothetical protein
MCTDAHRAALIRDSSSTASSAKESPRGTFVLYVTTSRGREAIVRLTPPVLTERNEEWIASATMEDWE